MAKHRRVLVDGSPVGMVGLDTILQDLKAEGYQPGDPALERELLTRVERENYIPFTARDTYGAALSREYAAYLAQGDQGAKSRSSKYRDWRGIPREEVPWYPTIDEDLCDGCGACLRMCRTGALVAAPDGKVSVAEPFACVVGCSACANLCKPHALLFPPRSVLDALQPSGRHARSRVFGR